jgi:hypothetical protein
MTKVIKKKLGRHGVNGYPLRGLCLTEDDAKKYCKKYGIKPVQNLILIDPRQKEIGTLDTLIHEKLHILFEEGLQEYLVSKIAKELAKFLSEQGY